MTIQESILQSMQSIDSTLKQIDANLATKSFFDSTLFAALIGAVGALLLQEVYKAYKHRQKGITELYETITKNGWAYDPDSLMRTAKITIYGGTEVNQDGEKNIIPEKPLGEKMIIELRRNFKYWTFPRCKTTRKLKKYEKKLALMNNYRKPDFDHKIVLKNLKKIYSEIEEYSLKKLKESKWTTQ